jgi:seryl-tRNA synthetase
MLQVAEIKRNRELFASRLAKRGLESIEDILDNVISLDELRKEIQSQHDNLLAEMNNTSKTIGLLMKAGNNEEVQKAKSNISKIKEKAKDLYQRMESTKEELTAALYNIPNIPNELVPSGNTEEDNECIFIVESLPELTSDAQPHWDLINTYDIVDFDLGIKITGAGFPVYKGKGAKLQRALINFFLDEAGLADYIEIQPPIVINEASGIGTGQLPDKEGQMYHLSGTDMYLIPTAEVPITNIYRDVILEEGNLPIKNVAYTPCFRKEAGSWGAHVRGLNRLHQFDKVEIVQVQHPDKSYDTLKEMMSHVEGLLQKLGLPYRILRLCGGDLGFTSALTYDFEVYSAGQKRWLEVSSVSNFETYQANRLKLRYRTQDNKKILLHTLNGSALALPRILATILENGQTDKGITIPEVLRKYTGFDQICK